MRRQGKGTARRSKAAEPKIHAVEMVRRIREEHYAQLKELTPQEKIAFSRRKAGILHAALGRHAEKVL